MPFILMAGRAEDGGLGFTGSPGGQPIVQGAPRALQGSDVPLGYDEGMVRMASAIGADLALMSQKNAAFNLGAVGTTLSKGLGSAGKAISSGVSRATGAVGTAVGNATTRARSAVGGVFKPPAPPKVQAPTPHVAPGVGAPANSTGRVNTGTATPVAAPTQAKTIAAGPLPAPPQPQQSGAMVHQPTSSTTPAPHPPPPPQPPLNQVMADSPEALSRPGATPENAIKPGLGYKAEQFWNKAKTDLGDGKWKRKGLALGLGAAGTYAAYRGAKGMANWMERPPAHHTANEGGVVPAYGVNQYNVADRSTPFNY